MGDTIQIQEVPTQLVQAMSVAVDHSTPGKFEMGVNGCAELEDMLCHVLHAIGHHIIDPAVQADLDRALGELLPAEPYERREALDRVTWSVLAAIGVNAL